jgi:aromatic ring-opening dioxygenase catalytic subunit (LigB family)
MRRLTMAKIVTAMASSHIPLPGQLQLDPAPKEKKEKVFAGFAALRKVLLDARPDILIVIADEHFLTFFLDNMPTFCIGLGDRWEAWGEGGLPAYVAKGHPDLAKAILRDAIRVGFDLSSAVRMKLDHGFFGALHWILPEMNIPLVPIFQNCQVSPLPTLRRCYALGQAIRRGVEERPDGERVAILGTGGLSHWLGMKGMGRVNEKFDRAFLECLEEGDVSPFLDYNEERVEREAGNGGQEIRNWVTMLGAVEGRRGKVHAYVPVPEWLTGMGMVSVEV